MLRALLLALALACASAFNVAAVRSAQPALALNARQAAVVMKGKSEKELRAEAIAKAKAELAKAEAERAAALAEKEAALKAMKKGPELPKFEAPKIELPKLSLPSVSVPKLSAPSVGAPKLSAKSPKLDLENPAVKALVGGAAVGLAPAAAIIGLRSFLDVRSTRAHEHTTARLSASLLSSR